MSMLSSVNSEKWKFILESFLFVLCSDLSHSAPIHWNSDISQATYPATFKCALKSSYILTSGRHTIFFLNLVFFSSYGIKAALSVIYRDLITSFSFKFPVLSTPCITEVHLLQLMNQWWSIVSNEGSWSALEFAVCVVQLFGFCKCLCYTFTIAVTHRNSLLP
jgi:hypothetical protein